MKSIIASLAVFLTVPLANAALIITEFALGPDGQEFVVIANTASGPPVNLSNISISVNNGATINPVGLVNIMQPGDTAILARQTFGSFVGTYGFPPVTVDYFATITGLDFLGSGASGIILYDSSVAPNTPFYSVGYGGGGYGGDLCIVINPPGGGTPSTAANTTAFSTVPEPGSAMLAALGVLGLVARRRRGDG